MSTIGISEGLVEDARQAARAAADSAGITIRMLHQVEEFSEVVALFERIWTSDHARGPVNTETLRAISTAGSYLAGAFDGDQLVGACMGFFAAPSRQAVHSHIAGVDGRMRGRNVGFAIKAHQRAWALGEGIHEISWTFDPLISRNAHFNLVKLGARASTYHCNYYGQMSDVLNGGDDTDRLLVTWDLLSGSVAAACHGKPATLETSAHRADEAETLLEPSAHDEPTVRKTDAGLVLARLPNDIEALRRRAPETASRWRAALRESLGALMDDGGRVLGFDSSHRYVIVTKARS
ncbi:GNAT family N-acetyltransferase [Paenarthrobacter sp. NPDC056912]|uniref:GNAT family N-acetyltransferase n=1 Tax=Paenarthrobacter sp. NPDC056912 TaxID=3345965 RepID=UPI00366BFB81